MPCVDVLLPAGEKQKADRPLSDNQRAGEAGATSLAHDAARCLRLRLGFEIGFKVIDNARLARLNDPLKTAAHHGLGITARNLHRTKFGARPMSRELGTVFAQECAANAIVRNDATETFEDPVEHIGQKHALLDVFDQLEQPLEFALLPLECARQQLQLVAEPRQWIGFTETDFRYRITFAEHLDPGGQSFRPLHQLVGAQITCLHDHFREFLSKKI